MLFRALGEREIAAPVPLGDALRGAWLTAQVRHGNLVDVAAEVVDVALALGVRPTLLKGISISEQHYPEPCLRPMGDIDVLVPAQAAGPVEAELVRGGCERQTDQPPREGAHHGIPLYHPGRRVWIEIHTAIFPADAGLDGKLFGTAHLAEQSVASTFQGRPVDRFTPELQFAYLAAASVRDLSRNKVHPTLAVPFFDAVRLFNATGAAFDWDAIARRLDNDRIAAALYLVLTFLWRRGLCPQASAFLPWLAQRQRTIGTLELKVLLRILDEHLIAARPFPRYIGAWHAAEIFAAMLAPGPTAAKFAGIPWKMLFPPAMPQRFDLRWQSRRFAAMLRGRN
jgi:hypothetical protein